MREILFRGKRLDNNEWIYGDLFRTPSNCGSYWEPPSQELDWFITDSYLLHHPLVRVIPETVGQFTGLVDKDGNKIFEGQKVKVLYTDWASKTDSDEGTLEEYLDRISSEGIVVFSGGNFWFQFKDSYGGNHLASVNVGKHGFIKIID